LFFFFVSSLCGLPVHALYNGNPLSPMIPEEGFFLAKEGWFGIKTGYEYDHVFSKSLRMAKGCKKKNVDDFKLSSNLGVLTFSICDRAELYGKAGVTQLSFSDRPHHGTKIHYDADNHFSWGVGGRAILGFWGNIFFGIEASYQPTSSPLHSIDVSGHSYRTEGAKIDYREWQVALATAYKFKLFAPYVGVQYTDVRARASHLKSLSAFFPTHHFILKNQKEFGLFLGCTIAPERLFSFNCEARFLNETAITLSADLRF
jgi:hypothetical protein